MLLKADHRKAVLTIMEDEVEEKSQKLIKLLKAAASANSDLVFAYVGVKQWEDFADTFEANKNTNLPKMIVWDGSEEYLSVSLNSSKNHMLLLAVALPMLVIATNSFFNYSVACKKRWIFG